MMRDVLPKILSATFVNNEWWGHKYKYISIAMANGIAKHQNSKSCCRFEKQLIVLNDMSTQD
jgi:hypothetical protein